MVADAGVAESATTDFETHVVSVFHFRAGQQVERWFYPEDIAAWDAIFNG